MLSAYLSQATGLVSNRAALLAARLAQPAQKGVGEMVDFLALQLLNRYQTMLVHFKEDMSPHPLAFYHAVCFFRRHVASLNIYTTFIFIILFTKVCGKTIIAAGRSVCRFGTLSINTALTIA